jgi:hypothetical protein
MARTNTSIPSGSSLAAAFWPVCCLLSYGICGSSMPSISASPYLTPARALSHRRGRHTSPWLITRPHFEGNPTLALGRQNDRFGKVLGVKTSVTTLSFGASHSPWVVVSLQMSPRSQVRLESVWEYALEATDDVYALWALALLMCMLSALCSRIVLIT